MQGADGNFYGTLNSGGGNGNGAIVKVTPQGAVTTLYAFSALSHSTYGANADGAYPTAALVQAADGNFYGTAQQGGSAGYGTVFKIVTNGTASGTTLTTLANFTGANGADPEAALLQGTDGDFYGSTGSGGGNGTLFKVVTDGTAAGTTLTTLVAFAGTNGAQPVAPLIQGRDGNFYGTTPDSGANNSGTVFKLTPAGALTTLFNFDDGIKGGYPLAALLQARDGNFYGTTSEGGAVGNDGTVFKVVTDGTASGTTLTTLAAFTGADAPSANGEFPDAPLIQGSDGNFYGTASEGGTSYGGTVFKVTPSGTLTTLYDFTAPPPMVGTGAAAPNPSPTGAAPNTGLVLGYDGNFYGTTGSGGASGTGTVFKITAESQVIYSFSALDGNGDNIEGADPGGLALGNDGDFYGTTEQGGANGYGTVFKVTSSGTVTTLHSSSGGDGTFPQAALVLGRDGNFYGTTYRGGANGYGTVFNITPSGTLTPLINLTGRGGGGSFAPLIQGRDGAFYGTTYGGDGTIFKIVTDGTAAGTTLTTLVAFVGTDGSQLIAPLIQGRDGNFYGTTSAGGSVNGGLAVGTAFKMTPQGVLTTLYDFDGGINGGHPSAGLFQGADGAFYGTASQDGAGGNAGTLFKIVTDGTLAGTTLTKLIDFNGTNAQFPATTLLEGPDGNLYGTTDYSASYGGTVFKVTPTGMLTILEDFVTPPPSMITPAVTTPEPSPVGTSPNTNLVLGSDGDFYGTTYIGSVNGTGTIYRLTGPPQGFGSSQSAADTRLRRSPSPSMTRRGLASTASRFPRLRRMGPSPWFPVRSPRPA